MDRRAFLKNSALAGTGLVVGGSVLSGVLQACAGEPHGAEKNAYYTQAPLPYSYDALAPHIDARTMEIHYGKHHAGYIQKLNDAVAKQPELASLSLEQLLAQLKPDAFALRNNGGGTWNHTFFWNCLTPAQTTPKGQLAEAIQANFNDLDGFRKVFADKAAGLFGSGWVWLIQGKDGKLFVATTPNQDNPLMPADWSLPQGKPLLALDVWEHAYYLNYQNRRAEYISQFWNIVNWDFVARQLA
ncbi:MAG: superoxide dismutase [Bacteroidetes bacterium]|nr:superoxide dismutase [Bacteroidota bacterium]